VSAARDLDARTRGTVLDTLEREQFDLAIVGGGITGAGVAREASLRGLHVALLEADDFASGTSSRSSKLIHGGLRYLAMGEVALVRSTALERKEVHRIAPHLAEPRWMLVPTRSRAGLLKFRAALTTYEKLGAVADADRHRTWDREDLAQEEPSLDLERYAWACVYREYQTDDARLVLAALRSAAAAGAVPVSHAPVETILREGSRATGVVVRCALSGRELRIRARAVVNAAGPWVDAVARLEQPAAPPRLMLSKGVHVVLPAERLPVKHLVVLQTDDRRSIFAIRRDASVYLGTTDTSYEGGPGTWPPITLEDVEYLLKPANRDFTARLAPGDVVAAWAGLRPLIAQPGRAAREMSRKEELWDGPLGVVTVAGGKLTGYRLMARSALERAAARAGLELAPTAHEEPPLVGGDFSGPLDHLAADLRSREPSLADETAARLVRLYGTEAAAVVRRGAAPLVAGGTVLCGEVDHAVVCEAACRLEDVLYRRTRAALYAPVERTSLVAPMAARMAALLGWDDSRREREESRALGRMNGELKEIR
jgi:glycerol-3-phosphate dehydrogenase